MPRRVLRPFWRKGPHALGSDDRLTEEDGESARVHGNTAGLAVRTKTENWYGHNNKAVSAHCTEDGSALSRIIRIEDSSAQIS